MEKRAQKWGADSPWLLEWNNRLWVCSLCTHSWTSQKSAEVLPWLWCPERWLLVFMFMCGTHMHSQTNFGWRRWLGIVTNTPISMGVVHHSIVFLVVNKQPWDATCMDNSWWALLMIAETAALHEKVWSKRSEWNRQSSRWSPSQYDHRRPSFPGLSPSSLTSMGPAEQHVVWIGPIHNHI